MFRKAASAAVRFPSVREHLRAAVAQTGMAFRALRMEWFSNSHTLHSCRNVKVNVGCGPLIREGWINVDLYPIRGVHYLDVRNGLPFADVSVTHLHCEHFLEHLSFDQAETFLRDCHRVLIPGGTMRIIVPDAEKYISAYSRNDREFFEDLKRLGNTQQDLDTPIKVINQMFRMGGDHRFAWDFDTLGCSARAAGFSDVARSSFQNAPPELSIDGTDWWRIRESLYVMLRK